VGFTDIISIIESAEEVQKLINGADEPLKAGITLLVYTGMRRGELFHLRKHGIDFNAGNIRIWPYGSYSPKGKRPRTIPISDETKGLFNQLAKDKKPDDYIFRPFQSEHRLYKRFAEHVKKLGIKGTLHDLRHTFA